MGPIQNRTGIDQFDYQQHQIWRPQTHTHLTLNRARRIALLEVQDQGIGIAPEDHGKIFERFERVVPTGNKASGLGLGLHIVKEIVVAHQGTIHVESDIGTGSKFTVELPLQATLM